MSLYKRALDRIIEAYDTKRPVPTRLQNAGAVLSFDDKLDRKEIYKHLTRKQREDVKTALIAEFHGLALEQTYAHGLPFYVHGLEHLFHRAVHGKITHYKDAFHNLTIKIKSLNSYPAYIDFVKAAHDYAAAHPDDCKTLTDLIDKTITHASDGSLGRTIFNRLSGHMEAERQSAREQLQRCADQYDPITSAASIAEAYMPKSGPETAEELYACLFICYEAINSITTRNETNRLAYREGIYRLGLNARSLCLDLSDDHLDLMSNIGFFERVRLLRESRLYASLDPVTIALGLTRYFIEHHSDKIPEEHRDDMATNLQRLYTASHRAHFKFVTARGYDVSQKKQDDSLQKMLKESWVALPRPSVIDLISALDQKFDGKKRRRFGDILTATADFFEPVVTFYSEQHEDIRKLRRSLFKNAGPKEGQDAFRKLFIKSLATNHKDALLISGFQNSAIEAMEQTGRIPEEESRRFGDLTVDHIIDIHCGGTNDLDNFVLVPQALNKLKNDILLLQTGMIDKSAGSNGFWVIVLRPKPGTNGETPKIIIPPVEECHNRLNPAMKMPEPLV